MGAVRSTAVRLAGEVLLDLNGEFWNSSDWRLAVLNEAGAEILTIRLSADDNSAISEIKTWLAAPST